MFMNIEAERIRRRMSKAELATHLSVPTHLINDWICGRRAIPADKLRKMSQIFDGLSLDYLLKT